MCNYKIDYTAQCVLLIENKISIHLLILCMNVNHKKTSNNNKIIKKFNT